VWQVIWAVGALSAVILLMAGISSAVTTATVQTCPGASTPSDANGYLGVLCEQPITRTTRPHELRGLLLIGLAVVWTCGTIYLARKNRPAPRNVVG
jgi:hypothetical protein